MIDEMQGGGGRERMVAMERERVSGRMAKQGCECAFGYVVVFVWRKWERNYRLLLHSIVSFIGLFCKRDLSFSGAY